MSNVIVMPGTVYQKELILFLKEKKHYVITVNPCETEATKNSDEVVFCDIFDTDKIVEKLNGKKINQIYTDQSDIALLPCSRLSEKLNIQFYLKQETIEKFSSNKFKMYKHAEENNILTLECEKAYSVNDITFEPPFVFKPTDTSNSRGVIGVFNKDNINDLFQETMSFTKEKYILVQKYINPDLQIIVDGICLNKKHYNLAHSYKGPYWSIAVTSFIRWPLNDVMDDNLIKNLNETNNKFVQSTGCENCITHAEYLYKDNKFYLNEIACRGGGFHISSNIAPYVSSINIYEYFYNSVNKKELKFENKITEKSAILKFYKQELKNSKLVEKDIMYESNFRKREYTKNESNPRLSFAIIKSKNNRNLDKKIKEFENICLSND